MVPAKSRKCPAESNKLKDVEKKVEILIYAILAKTKLRIFCRGKTEGGRGGGKIKIVFKIAKMRDFVA